MVIKIIQINMTRCAAGMAELLRYLQRHKPDVVLNQEPYATHGVSWPGCRIFHGSRFEEDICTSIEISHTTFNCRIINSYFKYGDETAVHLQTLERALAGRSTSMVVISADVNAKSVLWHNDLTYHKGEELERFYRSP